MPIKHVKTVTIADPTQPDLDIAIAEGKYPSGTLLTDIALASDFNADHDLSTFALTDAPLLQSDISSLLASSLAPYLLSSTAAATYVSLGGSYANPSWINSLAWGKITGAPAFITSSALTPYALLAGATFTGTIAATNLSGTNTGDNAVNSLYSGLVSNATHTGDVTGATALTIANNVVTNAKAAQMAANTIKGNNTGSTANASDLTVTQVQTMLGLIHDGALFGDGSDGDVTISSGTTTLARNMYYNNLTLNGTGILNTKQHAVFVRGTLDIKSAQTGAIINNGSSGGNSAGAVAGAAGAAITFGQKCIATQAGTAGAVGVVGVGVTGGAPTANALAPVQRGTNSGRSGAGGNGTSGAGGANGDSNNATSAYLPRTLHDLLNVPTIVTGASAVSIMSGTSSARGGSSGAGDGVNLGRGGGGGGSGAGCIFIYADMLDVTGATVSVIQAMGGNGGNGGVAAIGNTGGGGGGGGGCGGLICIVYRQITGSASDVLNISGGNGGNGSAGAGTGTNGNGGHSGSAGGIALFNLTTGIISVTTNTTVAANSGATGGTATIVRGNL
jgi:hypothetical protein